MKESVVATVTYQDVLGLQHLGVVREIVVVKHCYGRQPGSSFKPVFKGGKVVYPIDVAEIISEVSRLDTEDEIIKYLDADDRLKPADLKKIGKELGVDLPASAKDRAIIGEYIAKGLSSYGMH